MKLQLISFILGFGSTGLWVTQAATPHIEFEKTVWDFGTISQADSVKGTFGFRNTGDAVLNVEEPTVTCGCITAELKNRSIPPGHKGELTFILTMPSVRSVLDRQNLDPLCINASLALMGGSQSPFPFFRSVTVGNVPPH